jgi:hypothetical protein
MAFPTGWTKRVEITIPAAQVGSGGVSSFTVLLTESSVNATAQADIFANAKSDGADLRISTDAAGTNALTVDVLAFDASGGSFVIRAGTTSLSAVSANTLYLWWGNAAASAQTGSAAYDADWVGYWPDGGVTDRTANGYNLTTIGTPTAATGPFGGPATLYDAAEANTTTASGGPLRDLPTTFDFTMSLWSNRIDTTVNRAAMAWHGTDDMMIYPNDSSPSPAGIRVFWRDMGANILRESVADYSGSWSFANVVVRSSSEAEAYRDAVSRDINTTMTGTPGPFSGFSLGSWGDNLSQYLNGTLAEAQVHSTARGVAWIETEYNQTDAPASFASSGDPVAVGGVSIRSRSRWA